LRQKEDIKYYTEGREFKITAGDFGMRPAETSSYQSSIDHNWISLSLSAELERRGEGTIKKNPRDEGH